MTLNKKTISCLVINNENNEDLQEALLLLYSYPELEITVLQTKGDLPQYIVEDQKIHRVISFPEETGMHCLKQLYFHDMVPELSQYENTMLIFPDQLKNHPDWLEEDMAEFQARKENKTDISGYYYIFRSTLFLQCLQHLTEENYKIMRASMHYFISGWWSTRPADEKKDLAAADLSKQSFQKISTAQEIDHSLDHYSKYYPVHSYSQGQKKEYTLKDAKQYIQAILYKKNPLHQELLENSGQLYTNRRDYVKAIGLSRTLTSLYPKDHQLLLNTGKLLLQASQPSIFAQICKKLLSQTPPPAIIERLKPLVYLAKETEAADLEPDLLKKLTNHHLQAHLPEMADNETFVEIGENPSLCCVNNMNAQYIFIPTSNKLKDILDTIRSTKISYILLNQSWKQIAHYSRMQILEQALMISEKAVFIYDDMEEPGLHRPHFENFQDVYLWPRWKEQDRFWFGHKTGSIATLEHFCIENNYQMNATPCGSFAIETLLKSVNHYRTASHNTDEKEYFESIIASTHPENISDPDHPAKWLIRLQTE